MSHIIAIISVPSFKGHPSSTKMISPSTKDYAKIEHITWSFLVLSDTSLNLRILFHLLPTILTF
jgi:hypothetical protein